MRVLRSTPLLSGLLLLAGCGGGASEVSTSAVDEKAASGPTDPAGGEGGAEAPSDPAASGGSGDAGDSSAKLVRATAAIEGKVKSLKSLHPEIRGITEVYSLEAEPDVPGWGQPLQGEHAVVRDDDDNTTATCESGERPCAIGLHFGGPARVRVIKLFAAAGPNWKTFTGSPRPRTIKVHTDAGWAEAKLADGGAARYVLLPEPVVTTSITVELIDVYPGKKDDVVHFGELEAFGIEGPAREPLDIDPGAVSFRFENERWKHKQGDRGGYWVTRPSFLELVSGETARRMGRATAVHGKKGDRFLLLQHLRQTDCDEHQGSFILLDQKTRLRLNLGVLGGLDQLVYRHAEGLGFVVGDIDGEGFPVKGAVLDEQTVKRKRPPRNGIAGSPHEQLTTWGFETQPSPRDGSSNIAAPTPLCERATKADLGKLPKSEALAGASDLETWIRCNAGDGFSVLLHGPRSGFGAHASYVIDARGKVTDDRWSENPDAAGPRVTKLADGRLAWELDRKQGNEGALFGVDPEGKVVKIAKGAGLALRMPGQCIDAAK